MHTPSAARPAPPVLLVAAAFAVVYVIWGSTYFAIKVGLETLPPFTTAGARALVAGAILFGVARLRGTPAPSRAEWKGAGLVGLLLLLGGNGGVMWAQTRVPSGLASVLIATVPVFMVLLERRIAGGAAPPRAARAGVAIGFAGVALLVGPSLLGRSGGADAIDPLGALALLTSAGLWAGGSLLSRRVALPGSPIMATAAEMLCGGAALTVVGLAAGEAGRLDPALVSGRSALAWLYLVVFGSIVAFSAYVWLLGVVSPTRVATYAYVNPVVALLLGSLVAREPLGGRTVAACAVIVVGTVVVVTARQAPAPAAAPPAPVEPPLRTGPLAPVPVRRAA